MSNIFLKINLKFYSIVTAHNQTYELVYSITTKLILLQHILFLVIKITIPVVILIQCTKYALSERII